MTTIADDNTPYKLLVEQGSTPTTPAAGKQVLFIDSADHKLKRVNSSGTVTTVEGGGGIASGTSFPGGPATNDLYFRTDRGILYFYDGTRWLSMTLYQQDLGAFNNISANTGWHLPVWEADYDVYVQDLYATMYTASGLSGTAYWRFDLYFWDGSTQGSAIATVNNQSGTNNSFERKKATINALMGSTKDAIELAIVKVSTPGVFYGGAFLTYRLVG